METLSKANPPTRKTQHLLVYLFHDTGTIHMSIEGTQVLVSIAKSIIRLSLVNPRFRMGLTYDGVPLHHVNSNNRLGKHKIT